MTFFRMILCLIVSGFATTQGSAALPNIVYNGIPSVIQEMTNSQPPKDEFKANIPPDMSQHQPHKRTFGKSNCVVIIEGLSRTAYNITRTAEMVRTWTEYGNDVEILAKTKEKKYCSEYTSEYSSDLFRRFEAIIGALGESAVHINELHLLKETQRRQVQFVVGDSLIPAIDQFVLAATNHNWDRPKPCNKSLWDVSFIRADDLIEKSRNKMANLEDALEKRVFQVFGSE